MMEKRNFVTSARTPGGTSASDIDDILDAAGEVFGQPKRKSAAVRKFEKKASAEDERTDSIT
jgi:hypothetical protein